MNTKWLNLLERALWTLLQVVSAEALLSVYENMRGPLEPEMHGAILVILTALLSALKTALAQKFGSGTGATLPKDKQPVLAENVVAKQTETGDVVAGTAAPQENGTLVEVVTAPQAPEVEGA